MVELQENDCCQKRHCPNPQFAKKKFLGGDFQDYGISRTDKTDKLENSGKGVSRYIWERIL